MGMLSLCVLWPILTFATRFLRSWMKRSPVKGNPGIRLALFFCFFFGVWFKCRTQSVACQMDLSQGLHGPSMKDTG